MSPRLLAQLRRVESSTRRTHFQVRKDYGDDGSRYPRDYYRPLELSRLYSDWVFSPRWIV